MKRISILFMITLLTSWGAWGQEAKPYRVIDSTMVFSEDDFRIEPFHLGYGVSVLHNNYPGDESFGFMESAKLMCWMPKFNLQIDERITSADDISCEFEDEVLFLDDPQIFTGTKTPLAKDFPSQPFYAYKESVRGGLLSDWEAKSGETDYLFPIRTIMVKVSPFRYDSEAKKLYLNKRVRIKIRLAERPKNKYVQEGVVRDQDGNPIAHAQLKLADDWQVLTDSEGRYTITVETWNSEIRNRLEVIADGYTHCVTAISNDFPLSKTYVNYSQDFRLYNAVTFKAGEMRTLILPTAPDASLGRFYRFKGVESKYLVFERELSPKAYCPYILIPEEDSRLELAGMDLQKDSLVQITDANGAGYFFGSIHSRGIIYSNSLASYTLDTGNEYRPSPAYIEALHATLLYPYGEHVELLLLDSTDNITAPQIVNGKLSNGKCYDLSGRRIDNNPLPRGIYIKDGRKVVVK